MLYMPVLRVLLVAVCALLLACPARAQLWPAKPVRIVVAYPAGGGIDVMSRPLAARLPRAAGPARGVVPAGGGREQARGQHHRGCRRGREERARRVYGVDDDGRDVLDQSAPL